MNNHRYLHDWESVDLENDDIDVGPTATYSHGNQPKYLDQNPKLVKDITQAIANDNRRTYLGKHPTSEDIDKQHDKILHVLDEFSNKNITSPTLGKITSTGMVGKVMDKYHSVKHRIGHTFRNMFGMNKSKGGKKRRGKYTKRVRRH